jgi:nitroimidazol reductase NimA-like FMN-containing flavoprotein (pyridoxamine 5'-phosphate oxidase superfamily)
MDNALIEQIEFILANGKDMTIATLRDDGFPQATTVSYVSDGLTIYFGCDPNAQKAKNITRNNKVSLTVDLDYSNWNEIQSLSMGALAERVTDPDEVKKMARLMLEKFPQVADYVPQNPDDIALFRVTPKVVSLLDYSKGFGHTDLVEL